VQLYSGPPPGKYATCRAIFVVSYGLRQSGKIIFAKGAFSG